LFSNPKVILSSDSVSFLYRFPNLKLALKDHTPTALNSSSPPTIKQHLYGLHLI
jgi:hypothetical protein